MYFDRIARILVVICLIGVSRAPAMAAGPSYDLSVATNPGQLRRVNIEIDLEGQLKLNPTGGEITQLPLRVQCKLEYDEKLLEIDRTGQRRHSVRYYHRAGADIQIGKGRLKSQLSDARRLIVAEADKDESLLFSTEGALSRDDLDLIDVQGNTLLLDSLLPEKSVAIGDTWQSDSDSLAQILGCDVISQNEVFSQLVSVDDEIALVETSGLVTGAVGGVATEIKLKATCKINLNQRRIDSLTLAIHENRSIGHAEPGFDVTSKVQISLRPIDKSQPLAEESLADLQLKKTPSATLLSLESSVGGFRLTHDRRWRVMADRREVTILRYVDQGDLIAQCNISRLKELPSGQLLQLEALQKDVQLSLDKHFGQFLSATQSTTDDGLRVLRVVVTGKVSELPIMWRYYHISNDKGYRAAYVFTLESRLAEHFGDVDLALTNSLELLRSENPDADKTPTPVAAPAAQQDSSSAQATSERSTTR